MYSVAPWGCTGHSCCLELFNRFKANRRRLDILLHLQHDATSSPIWDDPQRAQALVTEMAQLKDELTEMDR